MPLKRQVWDFVGVGADMGRALISATKGHGYAARTSVDLTETEFSAQLLAPIEPAECWCWAGCGPAKGLRLLGWSEACGVSTACRAEARFHTQCSHFSGDLRGSPPLDLDGPCCSEAVMVGAWRARFWPFARVSSGEPPETARGEAHTAPQDVHKECPRPKATPL